MTRHPLRQLLTDYVAIDLSHPLAEGMPNFPTHSSYAHDIWESYWDGDVAVAYQLKLNEHTGTHVDAPAHFIRDGHPQHVWIDAVDPTSLIARAVMIDVSEMTAATDIGIEALTTFENRFGPVEPADVVLFRTGWDCRWSDGKGGGSYLADWPGVGIELAAELVKRRVAAVGTDAIGLDTYGRLDYPAHYKLLGNGVLILENLANLSSVPPVFDFLAIPLHITGGSGSPLRPLAFVPRNTAEG